MKMHIYYFDKSSIKKYLKECGFDVLAIKTYRHTVSIDYLLYKTKKINRGLHFLVKLIKIIFSNRNIYLTIALGNFMEVYARKRPGQTLETTS